MRSVIKATLTALALCLLSSKLASAYMLTGKVINVADGDSITVLTTSYEKVKVRLYGIDAPEKKQAFGDRSKQLAVRLAKGQIVNVDVTGRDRYGRALGLVYLPDRTMLQDHMLLQGLAWMYRQYCTKSFPCDRFRQEENQARSRSIGLWSEPGAVPPWEWRKAKRGIGN